MFISQTTILPASPSAFSSILLISSSIILSLLISSLFHSSPNPPIPPQNPINTIVCLPASLCSYYPSVCLPVLLVSSDHIF